MNYLRARESQDHVYLKRAIATALRNIGFLFIVFEQCYCDVLALRPGTDGPFVLGVEIERSFRNVHTNIARDFANGCSQVLVACKDTALRDRVAAHLPLDVRERVRIRTTHEIIAGDTTWMHN
jgi:hypothetical protein